MSDGLEPWRPKTEQEGSVTKKRVLLVEDESLIRLIVAETLCDAGFDVVEAADGDEAVAILDGLEQFDLLMTDIQMPGKVDGNILASCAKSRQPGLPVVYTSGRPDTLTNRVGRCDAFVRKPFGGSEVLAAVTRLLAECG
jgi:CheY-like chemotaxis protein